MSNFDLPLFIDFDLKDIKERAEQSENPILFVFSCGYEERSLSQYKYVNENVPEDKVIYLCFCFKSYKDFGSRPSNDRLLSEHGINQVEVDTKDCVTAWTTLANYINDHPEGFTQIIIDYSSMPRNWYCMFANKMINGEIGPDVAMIYSHGEYFTSKYPCVGYGEFHEFSGRPNITTTREMNIFGLGFDSTRTHGIWTFLDPQASVAIIARSPNNKEHCDRVRRENPEIISASDNIYEVNINEFSMTLSTIIDIARKYSGYGDVALVPDGPKPIVLAMSLVPLYLDSKGVYCWHVGHVKPEEYEPIDIKPSGGFFGFCLA